MINFLESSGSLSGSSGSRLPHNLGMDFDIFRIVTNGKRKKW